MFRHALVTYASTDKDCSVTYTCSYGVGYDEVSTLPATIHSIVYGDFWTLSNPFEADSIPNRYVIINDGVLTRF